MTESAMGEALKTLQPRKKREKRYIRVCDCGAPMIWTFFFAYSERYCLNCGNVGGMLGTGKDVEATRELILKKKLIDAVWKILRAKMLPSGEFGRVGCTKDEGRCHDHREHLSKSEKHWDEIAKPYLDKFKGAFN